MLHGRPLYGGTAPRPMRHNSLDRQNIKTSDLFPEEMQQTDGLACCASGAMLLFPSNLHLGLRLKQNTIPCARYARCMVPGNLVADAQRAFSHKTI